MLKCFLKKCWINVILSHVNILFHAVKTGKIVPKIDFNMVKYMLGDYRKMNRHDQRENAMITVYQYLIVKRDIHALINDVFKVDESEIDPYFIDVIKTSVANEERYAKYIDSVLKKGWSYERLGLIEKAILLNGCAEFDLKKTESAVIIDQSVQLAKRYCDSDTYKLVNSVLDVI